MLDNIATHAAARSKPGPKGRVLEPYAREVLIMTREGKSMQDIVNWLAEPPRGVTITRQAVHLWVKARIEKLKKLNAVFANTGFGGPFQESNVNQAARPSERKQGLDPPRPLSNQLVHEPKSAIETTIKKRTDVREFMTEVSVSERSQNPTMS